MKKLTSTSRRRFLGGVAAAQTLVIKNPSRAMAQTTATTTTEQSEPFKLALQNYQPKSMLSKF